ncbi:MAG: TlpA family protein disulfide reductase [Armatimonadetes bacterium]|nr:TlpA family protein disulfide reductase [Armatimonadota bacterium]
MKIPLMLAATALTFSGCSPSLPAKAAAPAPPAQSKPGQLSGTVKVGSPAPDFELPDESGVMWKLSDYRGKTVLLDFWGFWCPYCVQELPDLRKINDSLKGRDFVLLGINTDAADAGQIKKQLAKSPVDWRQGLIPDKAPMHADYQVSEFPTKVLIDKKGTVVYIGNTITKEAIEPYL